MHQRQHVVIRERAMNFGWIDENVFRQFARRLNVSPSVTCRQYQSFLASRMVCDRRRSERPHSTTQREDRKIEYVAVVALGQRIVTAKNVRTQLKTT